MERQQRVIVVGGGISGLASAFQIEQQAKARQEPAPEVRVLEGAPREGGKIHTVKAEGFLCEWGPNGFLDKEPATFALCDALDLSDAILPAGDAFRKRYIYRKGKLHAVVARPLKFLTSGVLPFGAKLRLLREPWVNKGPDDITDESIASFARRRIGAEAARILIDAMQSGIYAGDPEQLSVRSCFPRVVQVESEYGSLIKGMKAMARASKKSAKQSEGDTAPGAGPSGHLTSFDSGMQQLVDALAQRLGQRVLCGKLVADVSPSEGGPGLVVRTTSGEQFEADMVLLACPAYSAAQLVRRLDVQLAQLLAEISYAALAVACLGYVRERVQHPLDGFGFLAPRDEGIRALGALWSSSIFTHRAPAGSVLLRVMAGGARDPEVLDLSDDALIGTLRGELAPILGLEGDPHFIRVFRHPRAIPQYNLGHAARLQHIERRLEQLPGLALTGNAYYGIGVNDCIHNATSVAERVLDRLRSQRSAEPANVATDAVAVEGR